MWADVFLVKDGVDPDPKSPNFDWNGITRYRKRESAVIYCTRTVK